MTPKPNHVKIQFHLKQDEDGYPPFVSEGVWAVMLPDGDYLLDNIPFFAREATLGDTVAAIERNGELWFSRSVAPSSNSLLRVVLFDKGRLEELEKRLLQFGCDFETMRASNLVAINVPPSIALESIQEYLRTESISGWLDYEEPILRHQGTQIHSNKNGS